MILDTNKLLWNTREVEALLTEKLEEQAKDILGKHHILVDEKWIDKQRVEDAIFLCTIGASNNIDRERLLKELDIQPKGEGDKK